MSVMNYSVSVEENVMELLRLVQLADSMGGKLSIDNGDLGLLSETLEVLLEKYLQREFIRP